eukprot:2676612-Prymnesium_polylepis.1
MAPARSRGSPDTTLSNIDGGIGPKTQKPNRKCKCQNHSDQCGFLQGTDEWNPLPPVCQKPRQGAAWARTAILSQTRRPSRHCRTHPLAVA